MPAAAPALPPPAASVAGASPEPTFWGLTRDDWLWLLGYVGVPAAVGGVLLWRSRRAAKIDQVAARPQLRDLGAQAFYDALTVGVRDGDLRCDRRPRALELAALKEAFFKAKLLGLSPTTLASSGRYRGQEVEPLRIDARADGTLHLHPDDCERYHAAKECGALAALADVVQRDVGGDAVAQQRAPVRLL